jgi:LCP family protein required for cell wall assembly
LLRKSLKWIAVAFAAIVICTIGYYGYAFYDFGVDIHENNKKEENLPPAVSPQPTSQQEVYTPPKWEGKERVNILLLGGDSRSVLKNTTPRSDTMMLVSVDPVTKKAHLFSILRDTYVKIPGYGEDRINTAYTKGGAKLAMQTVSQLMGIDIQYYVYTDFQGFVALVDAIGGVEIDVEKNMVYRDSHEPELDINLKKGLQVLDGKQALQYVRFRHDALSDYSRTERQRKFMLAVAKKMQTTSSILRLPSILNKMDPYITTNLTISDMLKLGALGFDVKAEGIQGVQVPPSNLLTEANIGGASVLTVNQKRLQQFVADTLEGKTPDTALAKNSSSGGSSASTSGSKDSPGSSSSSGTSGSSGSTNTSSGSSSGPKSSAGTSPSSGTKTQSAGSGSGTGGVKSETGSGSSSSGQKSAAENSASSGSQKPAAENNTGSGSKTSGSSAGNAGKTDASGSGEKSAESGSSADSKPDRDLAGNSSGTAEGAGTPRSDTGSQKQPGTSGANGGEQTGKPGSSSSGQEKDPTASEGAKDAEGSGTVKPDETKTGTDSPERTGGEGGNSGSAGVFPIVDYTGPDSGFKFGPDYPQRDEP